MENGSGVAEGDDQGGSPIISVGQDAKGLLCTARLCSRPPATMEEVDEACPIQARALIPESQFGQGQLPAQINLASDGTPKEVLYLLMTPIRGKGRGGAFMSLSSKKPTTARSRFTLLRPRFYSSSISRPAYKLKPGEFRPILPLGWQLPR